MQSTGNFWIWGNFWLIHDKSRGNFLFILNTAIARLGKFMRGFESAFISLDFIMHPAQPSIARLGGVHSIFGLPHDWDILGTEKGIQFERKLPVTIVYSG